MISYLSSHHHDGRLGAVAAGFLIGTFQLVGRSYFGQFMGSEAVAWYLQLRLLVLAVLSMWLLGVAAGRGPGAARSFAGGVRAWSAVLVAFVAYMVATTLWAPDLSSGCCQGLRPDVCRVVLCAYGCRATSLRNRKYDPWFLVCHLCLGVGSRGCWSGICLYQPVAGTVECNGRWS